MERRHTIQKDLIHKAVQNMRRHVTADEVFEFVKNEHPTIGKGTVYRNLGILADEGAIRKVEIPDGPDCFDFTLDKHYHVRCVKCGAVHDADIEVLENLEERIGDKRGMLFLDHDILFKGICGNCQTESEKVC